MIRMSHRLPCGTAAADVPNVCQCDQQAPRIQGLMRDTLRRFFVSYAHSAVTAGDLLCHLAHALAGCPVGDASSPDGCKPPQPAPTLPEAPGGLNITAPDAAAAAGSCAMVTPWRQRLDAWLVAPGIQVVEVSQGGTSPDTGMQLQALLQADDLPGQVRRLTCSPCSVAGPLGALSAMPKPPG